MFFETILYLFGIGVWSPGLQSVSVEPVFENIAPVEEKWSFHPVLSAEAVLIMDMDSATVVYEKNGYKSLPMASLTKIMTALVISENHAPDEILTISKGSMHTQGSTMKLEENEQISIENLLYGLMMNSGNDSAIALSRYHSGSTVYAFVERMNARAAELELTKTSYSNPHGFDSPYHYTSAYDTAKLAKKFLQNPLLRKIVRTRQISVFSEDGEIAHHLKNTNQLLGSIYPVYGLKTGTTPKAGQCLALLVTKGDKEYLIIILGSQDRYLDAKVLLWKLLM